MLPQRLVWVQAGGGRGTRVSGRFVRHLQAVYPAVELKRHAHSTTEAAKRGSDARNGQDYQPR